MTSSILYTRHPKRVWLLAVGLTIPCGRVKPPASRPRAPPPWWAGGRKPPPPPPRPPLLLPPWLPPPRPLPPWHPLLPCPAWGPAPPAVLFLPLSGGGPGRLLACICAIEGLPRLLPPPPGLPPPLPPPLPHGAAPGPASGAKRRCQRSMPSSLQPRAVCPCPPQLKQLRFFGRPSSGLQSTCPRPKHRRQRTWLKSS